MLDFQTFYEDPKNKAMVKPYVLWSRLRFLAFALIVLFGIPMVIFQTRFDNVIYQLDSIVDYTIEINGVLYLVFQLLFDGAVAFAIVAGFKTRNRYRALMRSFFEKRAANPYDGGEMFTVSDDALDVPAKESDPIASSSPAPAKKEPEIDVNSLSYRLKTLRESFEKGEMSEEEYKKRRNELLGISE